MPTGGEGRAERGEPIASSMASPPAIAKVAIGCRRVEGAAAAAPRGVLTGASSCPLVRAIR
eukprot:360019-Chlamydomonas_euryale.AAC.5